MALTAGIVVLPNVGKNQPYLTQLQKQEQRPQTIPLRPLIQTSGW